MLKKIVILGPESTGKSTLCEQLAAHYKTIWCPEYAREFLLKHGTNYTYNDLLTIAKGQLAMEDEYELGVRSQKSEVSGRKPEVKSQKSEVRGQKSEEDSADSHSPLATPHSLLFIDTDMYVMKVWCEFVFGNCHRFILDQIVERKYDLYLLCNIDLPWVEDELREYPDLETRKKLYLIYKDLMMNQAVPWVDISGNYEERLQKAITGISSFL